MDVYGTQRTMESVKGVRDNEQLALARMTLERAYETKSNTKRNRLLFEGLFLLRLLYLIRSIHRKKNFDNAFGDERLVLFYYFRVC